MSRSDSNASFERTSISASGSSASGAATVFVTHDVTEIPFLGDRTIVMNEGRIAADGSIRRVLASDTRNALSELLHSASWLCGKDGDDDGEADSGFPLADSAR